MKKGMPVSLEDSYYSTDCRDQESELARLMSSRGGIVNKVLDNHIILGGDDPRPISRDLLTNLELVE